MLERKEKSSRLLDQQFGAWVKKHFSGKHFSGKNSKEDAEHLCHLAEAVSYAAGLKHTCLDMDLYRSLGDPVLDKLLQGLSAAKIKTILDENVKPLRCSADGNIIWLQKYHAFEQGVARHLLSRAAEKTAVISDAQQNLLDQLFDENSGEQRRAAEKALTHRLAVITGGPGTGKTWTVARLMVLLKQENPDCRIQLAAPTGKAGARMIESLAAAFTASPLMGEYAALLPEKASTLDALLAIGRDSPKARKNKNDPLGGDVLIVDEASMIALPMMYRLLEALPATSKLILLGDKDQLASVEAGSVLGDICASDSLQACIAVITRSRRFAEGSEIGELARALNRGEVLLPAQAQWVKWHETRAGQEQPQAPWLGTALIEYQKIIQGLSASENSATENDDIAKTLLQQGTQFQILCALREGPFGVSGINRRVAEALGKTPDGWYEGRPLMVTQNDHGRHLYNGDVGLVLKRRDREGNVILKACFVVKGVIKEVSQAQMPPHETCYAMTVHKSQGSEYGQVALVLPDSALLLNPVLTRELVYTAVTRAKQRMDIWCGKGVLEMAAKRQLMRMSGLHALLLSRFPE